MMKAAESMVPAATSQMLARWAFLDRRFHPKIQMPRKVDSKKKASQAFHGERSAEHVAHGAASRPTSSCRTRTPGPARSRRRSATLMSSRAPKKRARRSIGLVAVAVPAVWRSATRKASPMVTGTKRKW